MCVTPAERGGTNTFSDSFAVAKTVLAMGQDLLTQYPLTFWYPHADRFHIKHRKLIDVCDGRVEVNYSPPFQGVLSEVPLQRMSEFYRSLNVFETTIDKMPMIRMDLKAGEMVIFENRRILHARDAFCVIDGEERHLKGAYLDEIRLM